MPSYSLLGENMIRNAQAFATAAHAAIGQKRKYTGEPYIIHPRTVAGIVQSLRVHTWRQVVIAWLHDTIEDTQITYEVIWEQFGHDIAEAVHQLTNVDKSAGNRAKRHQLNCERLRHAPDWVKTVKVADIYDNTKSIVRHDPTFAPQYLSEKMAAMEALKGADPILWDMTYEQIGNAALGLKVAS